MTKHTPGPWESGLDFENAVTAPSLDDSPIATTHNFTGYDDGQQEANARLIAAAPQLLEELRLAIQSLEHLNHGPHKGTERAKALMEALA